MPSNELKFNFSVEYRKGSGQPIRIRRTQTITVTGNNVRGPSVQAIGISAEVLQKPADMGTIGWVYLHNLDTTNFVAFGDDADGPSLKLKAGEADFVRWGATDVSAKADTAGCDVEYALFED